jgi:hypothetical protein
MYYKLKENILLRGWKMLPYALVDKTTKIQCSSKMMK